MPKGYPKSGKSKRIYKTKPLQKCIGCGVKFKAIGRHRKYCSRQCAYDHGVGGRKLFNGRSVDDVVGKIHEVWKLGGTDMEAIFYAEISKDSYYRYLDAHPEELEKREIFRGYPKLKARKTVVASLDESTNAWKYLQAKSPEEFKDPESGVRVDNHFYFDKDQKDATSKLDKDNQTGGGVGLFDGQEND